MGTKHNTPQQEHYISQITQFAKYSNQMQPPALTIVVVVDVSKAFDTINIHTLIGKPLQSISYPPPSNSVQTISKNAKLTQHSATTHHQHANIKLACPKEASYHSYYSTYTHLTCHNHKHQYKSLNMQTTYQ